MTQLFRNDEMSEFFYNLSLNAKQKVIIGELVQMNDEILGSKAFGHLLYDNNTFPVLTGLDRDFFAENYMAILQAMQTAGTYDSYTLVIEQVVGNGVSITYDTPAPRHLVIYIYGVESYTERLITPNNLWLTTPDNLGLLVPRPVSEFSLVQLRKILEILANPSGTYVDIRFSEPPLPDFITMIDAPDALERGDSYLLVAELSYTDDSTINSQLNPAFFKFESSNPSLATVDSDGNVSVLSDAEFGSVIITVTSVEDPLISSFVNITIYQKISYLTLTPSDPYSKGATDQVGYQLDDFGAVVPSGWLNIDGLTLATGSMRGYRDTSDNSQVFYIKSDYVTVPEGAVYFRWLNAEELMFTASNDTESHGTTLLWNGTSYVTDTASDLNAFLRANKGVALAVEIEILEVAKIELDAFGEI